MGRLLFFLTLVFSASCFAQQTHEEFVQTTLFNIVADQDSLGPRAMKETIDQAIRERIVLEPTTTHEILLNDLSDAILADKRWLVSDIVTRAATNLVSVLMLDNSNLILLTWFQYSLRKLTGAIDVGWSRMYRAGENGREVPAEKLARLENIAQIYETIARFRNEQPPSISRPIMNATLFCSVAFGPSYRPQL